jgi:hypothetical protein
MGYSIMTVFDNSVIHKEMLEFLENNHRKWSQLNGLKNDYVRGPTDDVSYGPDDPETLVIGFDYISGGDLEVHYAYTVCSWMARRIKIDSLLYDGRDINVLPEDCDTIGYYPVRKLLFGHPDELHLEVGNRIIQEELTRLFNLWISWNTRKRI